MNFIIAQRNHKINLFFWNFTENLLDILLCAKCKVLCKIRTVLFEKRVYNKIREPVTSRPFKAGFVVIRKMAKD